jgi:hypothetical protein
VRIDLHLSNTGLQQLPAGSVLLLAPTAGLELSGWLEALAPGQGQLLTFWWQPDTLGRHDFTLEIPIGEGPEQLRLQVGSYQVGPAQLLLSEVMAAPSAAGCEWIEIVSAAPETLSLADIAIRDEDGPWRFLPPVVLAPEAFCVLTEDRDEFLTWWESLLQSGAVPPCGSEVPAECSITLPQGWASLNNAPAAGRQFADRVYLGDASGTVLDHVTFGEGGAAVPAGRSLERIAPVPRGDSARNWGAATSPLGGTPGCPNSLAAAAPVPGSLNLFPNPFYPAAGAQKAVLHVQFVLRPQDASWEVVVFDLWGRQVRDMGGDVLGPGPREILWDGRDDQQRLVPGGAYVVLLRTYDCAGSLSRGQKRLAVVGTAQRP